MNRTEWRPCSRCPQKFPRPVGAGYTECLSCEGPARLAAAGITAGDPGLVYIAQWNGDARVRWFASRNEAAATQPGNGKARAA